MWLKFLQVVFFATCGMLIAVIGFGVGWGILLFFKTLWKRIFNGEELFSD